MCKNDFKNYSWEYLTNYIKNNNVCKNLGLVVNEQDDNSNRFL